MIVGQRATAAAQPESSGTQRTAPGFPAGLGETVTALFLRVAGREAYPTMNQYQVGHAASPFVCLLSFSRHISSHDVPSYPRAAPAVLLNMPSPASGTVHRGWRLLRARIVLLARSICHMRISVWDSGVRMSPCLLGVWCWNGLNYVGSEMIIYDLDKIMIVGLLEPVL